MIDREELKNSVQALARQGAYIGTSSWKYAGWCGMLYDPNRYLWRGKVAEKRFQDGCLAEYAEVFKTVCVDAAYYKFPDQRFLERMIRQVPDDFRFAFKVTDEITVKRFPNLPRFGLRAGQANPHFLDAGLFQSAFLKPCEPFQRNVGPLIFEFSHFQRSDFPLGREFMTVLDEFLSQLPRDWRYGVEIRNKLFLHQDYFAMLARHGVAHVYNSWTGMPDVGAQMALAGSRTSAKFSAARFLLKPGRTYEQAVSSFGPYHELKEIHEESRAAADRLIREALESDGREEAYIYVNNRLEGNALSTIAGMIAHARSRSSLL